MSKYPCMVSGLYESRESADMARQALLNEFSDQVHCLELHPGDSPETIYEALQREVRAIRDSLVGDTLLGSAISSGSAEPGSGGLHGTGIPLVAAAPVAASLWGPKHGATLGGTDGTTKVFRINEADHYTLVKAALHGGAHAVIAHVLDEAAVDVAYACLLRSAEATTRTQ